MRSLALGPNEAPTLVTIVECKNNCALHGHGHFGERVGVVDSRNLCHVVRQENKQFVVIIELGSARSVVLNHHRLIASTWTMTTKSGTT